MNNPKIYLVVGEHSGDIHGAELILEILRKSPNAEIRYMGGDSMEKAGGKLAYHYKDVAIMGFIEVLKNLSKIKKHLKNVRKDIELFSPDKIVFIDFPGFNLRLAKKLFSKFELHYYIAPKAWAWNKKRVYALAKYIKQVHCILPFEVDFFSPFGVQASYVGNPSKSQVETYLSKNSAQEKEYIALFPGSRKQEIERILPIMLEVIKRFEKESFKISKAANLPYEVYMPFVASADQLYEDNYALLNGAKAALVTSGTATLETALFGVPQVVCYVANNISYQIAKRLVSVEYISLVNLIAGKEVVTELIQESCQPDQIEKELRKILSLEGSQSMLTSYQKIREKLGKEISSQNVAKSLTSSSL